MRSKAPDFPAPVLVTSSADVARYCEKFRHEPFVTVDTEFVREKTYWPQLCLVQIAGAEDVVLIDALAPGSDGSGIDLTPLAALLDEAGCVKVFHAARQDLEIFLHLFGRLSVSVFDTQVAAMVAGFGDQVGYDSLVGAITGRSIDKAHRFSDWSARPLTAAQLAYAAADVTHLRTVYLALRERLEAQGRLGWADAEQAALTREETFRPDVRTLWEKLKARTSNRRTLGILREITAWREREAQAADVPRQRIIRDEGLLEIAAIRPESVEALGRVRGVTRGFAEGKMGQGLLAAVRTAERLPEDALPGPPAKSARPRASASIVALLRVLQTVKCEQNAVAPRLVASTEELERIALGEKDVEALKGWRGKLFGEDAQALMRGEIALCVAGDTVALRRVGVAKPAEPERAEQASSPPV